MLFWFWRHHDFFHTNTHTGTHTHTHTLWQKLRHQVPKSWKKMFHFISYAATPINKTEGQQFKPKLVTKQSPSTEPKVNSFNKSSYVYTGSIQCLRWPLTVYFPSGPLRAKMGCGRSDRSSKASTGFTSFEKVHTHTQPGGLGVQGNFLDQNCSWLYESPVSKGGMLHCPLKFELQATAWPPKNNVTTNMYIQIYPRRPCQIDQYQCSARRPCQIDQYQCSA